MTRTFSKYPELRRYASVFAAARHRLRTGQHQRETLSLGAYLSHAKIQNTARCTKMNATRFDGLWRDRDVGETRHLVDKIGQIDTLFVSLSLIQEDNPESEHSPRSARGSADAECARAAI